MVGRQGRKLSRARINGFEDGPDAVRQTEATNLLIGRTPQLANLRVAKSVVLGFAHRINVERRLSDALRDFVDENDLVEKPRVNPCCDEQLFDGRAGVKRSLYRENATVGGVRSPCDQLPQRFHRLHPGERAVALFERT